jgi:hypothetical protein
MASDTLDMQMLWFFGDLLSASQRFEAPAAVRRPLTAAERERVRDRHGCPCARGRRRTSTRRRVNFRRAALRYISSPNGSRNSFWDKSSWVMAWLMNPESKLGARSLLPVLMMCPPP